MKISELKESGRRNRYHRLRKVILAGVPELKTIQLIKIVEVSGRGSRQSLIGRNKVVRRRLAAVGFEYEDCFIAPMSQEDGWYQLKGLLRLSKGLRDAELLAMLEAVWLKRLVTKVRVVSWGRPLDLRRYIREEMLQAVVSGDSEGRHLVRSPGWPMKSGAVSGSDWFHVVREVEKDVGGEKGKALGVKRKVSWSEEDGMPWSVRIR